MSHAHTHNVHCASLQSMATDNAQHSSMINSYRQCRTSCSHTCASVHQAV